MRFKDKKKEPNKTKAYNYLIKKGVEPHIAAGLVGNLQQESYMLDKTWAKENLNDGVNSAGVMQWHGTRLDNLYDFYKQNNPDYKEGQEIPLEGQLDFILHEAKTGGGDRWLKRQYERAFKAETPEEAALGFSKFVVRPHKDYAHNDKRVSYAKELFQNNKKDEGYDFFNDPNKHFEEKQPALVDNPKRKEAYEKLESRKKGVPYKPFDGGSSVASMQEGGKTYNQLHDIYNARERSKGLHNMPKTFNPEKRWMEDWYNSDASKERLRQNVEDVENESLIRKGINIAKNPLSSREERLNNVTEEVHEDTIGGIKKQKVLYGKGIGEAIDNMKNPYNFISKNIFGKYTDTMGAHDPFKNSVYINENYGSKEAYETAVHEFSHASDLDTYLSGLIPEKKGFKRTEVYPRIMQFRYQADLKPDEKVTKETLNKIKDNSPYEKRFFEAYSDEEILDMMNNLASNEDNNTGKTVTAKRGRKIKK